MNNFPVTLSYFVHRTTWPGWRLDTRTISNYEIVLVTDGEGEVTINHTVHKLRRGSLLYFCPSLPHSLKTDNTNCLVFYAVHFETEEDPFSLPSYTQLNHISVPENLLRSLSLVHRQKTYLYQWHENLLLQNVLLELKTAVHREKYSTYHEVQIQKIITELQNQPCRKCNVEDLISQSGMKKSLFFQTFRQVTGVTPICYINRIRLEQARELLICTALSVTQIAEQCGFEDPFYFSRCFRKEFGLSPQKYRLETDAE